MVDSNTIGGLTGGVAANQKNNVYADRDGNVYRKDDDGWKKREGGKWEKAEQMDRNLRAVDRI